MEKRVAMMKDALEEKVAAALSKACSEEGICPEVLPGVKHARLMQREDGKHSVLTCLWEDGAISSCTFEDKEVKCCETEKDGTPEAYWAWVAHLAAVGYKEKPLEVEGAEVEGAASLELPRERIRSGADVP